jgi:hypothetical protein
LAENGPFRYRTDVLRRLWAHGVQPHERTRPELVREFVRDLYKYEIRRLREGLLRNEFPRDTYARRVDELRRQYPVLALRARDWLEGEN